MDDPNADTEWNDILRARGILPPKEGPTEEDILEAMDQVIMEKQDKHLEDKTLDELDELEDEEDERVLFEYRQKRIAEMKAEALRAKFGELMQISKPDFIREVTDASKEVWVVVHLFKDSIPECKLMNAHLATLAAKHKATKFIKIIGDQCIPNYPDKNLPTLLIYGEGDMKLQLVGLAELGGLNMSLKSNNVAFFILAIKKTDLIYFIYRSNDCSFRARKLFNFFRSYQCRLNKTQLDYIEI
ncbi:thioredoxin-like protein [Gigaspora margarita]|uniref:Thioredoxin-like protein n=1 Tax=Gigaspora margarita TaxID=4874 RepID=A0A8H3WXW2_GIGMA|nr:thioredoxin-like protein [Gigaspora margarita]